jgi:hypothetical protein
VVENRAESETNFGGLLTWRTDTGIVALITETRHGRRLPSALILCIIQVTANPLDSGVPPLRAKVFRVALCSESPEVSTGEIHGAVPPWLSLKPLM